MDEGTTCGTPRYNCNLTFDMQISKISAAVFNPISILHFLDLSEFSKEREKAASRGEYQKNKAKNQMDG